MRVLRKNGKKIHKIKKRIFEKEELEDVIKSRINYEYFRLFKELPFLFRLNVKTILTLRKDRKKKKRILIVSACLIGDFIVSLPAINEFITNNKSSVIDIVVSPVLKSFAEHLKGIRNVYVAK
ncbi:hypothetical protein D6745_00065, partial [Candidatus Woesearchaeota archaeon]